MKKHDIYYVFLLFIISILVLLWLKNKRIKIIIKCKKVIHYRTICIIEMIQCWIRESNNVLQCITRVVGNIKNLKYRWQYINADRKLRKGNAILLWRHNIVKAYLHNYIYNVLSARGLEMRQIYIHILIEYVSLSKLILRLN